MHRGASSSSPTTQYEQPTRKKTRMIKFLYQDSEISTIIETLIRKDKNIEEDLTKENLRSDYRAMAAELLSELLPFELPSEEDIKRQEQQLIHLLRILQAADKGQRSSSEADSARTARKIEKERIKALKATLQHLKEINEYILSESNIKKLSEHLEDYCYYREQSIDNGNKDYWPDQTRILVNKSLSMVKNQILEKFPIHFDSSDPVFQEDFKHLPSESLEAYRLRHAQSIVILKRAELSAISYPDDSIQNEYRKEQLLYSAQASQLQYDILQEMSKNTDKNHVDNVITAALNPILEQFSRGEILGAYRFKYRESVKEQVQEMLFINRELLLAREENEIKLEHFNEQYACFSALAKNPEKYGITTAKEGRDYERLAEQYKDLTEKAQSKQAELNSQLAQLIESFIDRNSIKENQENIDHIQSMLGSDISRLNLSDMMIAAEKKTQLGYYDWMFTKTFASRCKRALLMATTMGAVGVGVGGVAGLGIFSAFTAGLGGVGGGLTGLITGFTAPNIQAAASSNLGELRNLAINFFYGEQNEILKEYFEDPSNTKILAKKYAATPRMIEVWGVDGANVMAHHYANLLFELHIKILYGSDAKAKQELELQYKHFYRNYQMIRGDQAEITKIYQGDFWGLDRAENEIRKLQTLDIAQQARDDLAALMKIVTNAEQINIRQLRTAINEVAEGLQLLAIEGKTELMRQALEAPEVKSLAWDFIEDVTPQLLLTDGSHAESHEVVALPSSSASSSTNPASSSSPTSSSRALALLPQEPQQIIKYDASALEKQQLVTQVKQGAGAIVQAFQTKQEIQGQYAKIDGLATIATRAKTTATDIERTAPGFIRANTQFIGDMSAFDATTYFLSKKYAFFTYWYNNIFLFNNRATANSTRKDLISRSLRDGSGYIQFNGKSLWHIIAENSIEGRELFTQMMLAQQSAGFSPFIDYFDFDYQDENGMNAIVYAASLSSHNNNEVFKCYVEELMKGYKSGTEDQVNCDRTFKEVLQLKSPHNPAYLIICMKLKDEIRQLWKKSEAEKYAAKSFGQRLYSVATAPISSGLQFDSETVLSQLLATMAIHCSEGNPVPQTAFELIDFINKYKDSSYINSNTRTLLNNIEAITHIAEVTKDVMINNPLYEFATNYSDEKIKNLAIELCTSMPIPSVEEQAILISILSNNTTHLDQLISKKNPTLSGLIYYNTKFKDRNLIWIAIEANRPEIALKLFTISNHKAMDEAGPNNASAFTFAASQQDKTSCNLICREITARSGIVSRAYATRFKKDSSGAIGFHYLSQTGSIDDIIQYFQTETRYSSPDWHRLTGGPDNGMFYTDSRGNLPLHLLLSRDDVVDVVREIQEYVNRNKLNSIFDLFNIKSLEIRNNTGITPISVIMQSELLQRIIFEPLLAKTADLPYDLSFRDKLFTCARHAVEYQNVELLEQLMNSVKRVHEANKGRFRANPVEQEVDGFLDYLILRLRDANSEREIGIISELLKSNAKLASFAKLKSMFENAAKPPVNQLIIDAILTTAIERGVASAEASLISNASSSASSSADTSPSATPPSPSPSPSPDRVDDTSTRVSLILSGGHQISDRENIIPDKSKDQSKGKKKKHDPT